MIAPQRHRRQKFDRLLSPGASAAEITIDKALGPFDAATRAANLKWGHERLPELVSVETATKFGSALGKLNAAIESADVDEVTARVGVCLRGYAAMDAEAEASGAPKADPRILEYDLDGFRFGVMHDADCWEAAQAARPDLRLFTLREVAVALQSASLPLIDEVKAVFPGAKITAIKPKTEFDPVLGDEIPF